MPGWSLRGTDQPESTAIKPARSSGWSLKDSTTALSGADWLEKKGAEVWHPVNALLEELGTRIDATQAAMMNPLTRKFSTGVSEPLPEALSDLAKAPITGNPPKEYTRGDASYQAGIKGGLKPWQARTLAITGSLPIAGAFNAAGEAALVPTGRAIANAEIGGFRTRAALKPVLEFFKPGSSLPNSVRDQFYAITRNAEGAADWRAFLREKSLGKHLGLPTATQDAITKAIETKTIGTLPKESQDIANALVKEYRTNVGARIRAGLQRNELASDLEYAPRVMTKEERVARGLKPYGASTEGIKPGLSTGLGAKRTELGRELTTEQMSGGKPVFEPVVKGTLIRGAQNDARVMHADIIRKLDRQFGRPLKPGETAIADLRGVPTGFNPTIKARLAQRSLPPELHQVVEQMNQTFQPDQWGKASQFVRSMNDQFRKWALFSPGFISRNMQNNLVQTTVFGNMNPATWAKATAIRSKMASGNLSAAELKQVEEYVKNGVIGKGQVALESGTKGTKALASKVYNAPFRAMRSANTFGEDVSRISFYEYQKSKGLSPLKAAQKVDQVLFNYSPRFQSKGMSTVRRTAIPFINWKANIPQLFIRSALERPGSLGQIGNIRNQMNAANPDAVAQLPDYLKEQGATRVGEGRYLLPQGVGQFDVNSMTAPISGDIQNVKMALSGKPIMGSKIADELASQTYPHLGIIYAASTGRDPFTGYPIRDWPKFLAGKVPAAKIPILARDLASGKPGAKERAISFLTGIKTVAK